MQANFTAMESLVSLFCLDIVAKYFSSKTWFNGSINLQSAMRFLFLLSYMSDLSPSELNLECRLHSAKILEWEKKIIHCVQIVLDYYPGPRGFLLFFISKFCDANRFLYFFYWHEALRAEKIKPLVATVGNLTFMPSAFDRRFWLEDIFNCSMSHMIGWIKYLWGWEWSVYVHLYGYVWRTFALSTDSLTREG